MRMCRAVVQAVYACAGLRAILAVCAVPVDRVHRGEQPALCFSHRPCRPPVQQAVHLRRGSGSHGTRPSMNTAQSTALRF